MNRLVRIFIETLDSANLVSDTTKCASRIAVIGLTTLALISCGGGASDSDNGLLTTNPSPVEPLPPAPAPAPTNAPQPTAGPQPPTPTQTPPPVLGEFQIVDSYTFDGSLSVRWSDASADSYRLLFWQGNDAPTEHITSDLELSVSAPAQGDYTVIVEAYDALGNSVFSAPDFVEVTR